MSAARPLTMEQATERGLLTSDKARAIHTFSNGSMWECWGSANCFECRHWDPEEAGACAFEAAAFLGMVTPELAQLFGWIRDAVLAEKDGERFAYDPPDQCAFFRPRKNDDGEDNPPPPEPDPLQLVLLADPTEDAALMRDVPALAGVA